MSSNTAEYHYTECGLDNVIVRGLHMSDDTDDDYVVIVAVKELHALIAHTVLLKPIALTGREFYFIRAELEMNIKQLAKASGIKARILQNWEVHNTVTIDQDLRFRQFALALLPKTKSVRKLLDSERVPTTRDDISKHADSDNSIIIESVKNNSIPYRRVAA